MTVGIFSRESPDCYRWLVDFLQSFLPPGDVESLYIGNTSRIRPQDYTFSILYHSKTRGRINVTDVTDSLYDGELQALSRTLGKRNVIVVIDDLDNNSDEEKTQLLMSQPSIGMKAQELFLFTPEAKLKTDTNHVNISNKRRMKTIIEDFCFDSNAAVFTDEQKLHRGLQTADEGHKADNNRFSSCWIRTCVLVV